MATGSSELMMLTARRWVLRNAKRVRSSSSLRASLSCQILTRMLPRRLLQLLTRDSIPSTVSYLTILPSPSTMYSMVRFLHIPADIRRMQVSSHITMHGLSVQLLMQAKAIRHLSITQRLLPHSQRKPLIYIRPSHMYMVR